MRRSVGTTAAAAVLGAVLAAGCTGGSEPEPRTEPRTEPAPTATPSPADPSGTPRPGRDGPGLVVVGHATEPALRLTARQADRLTRSGAVRWRGYDVARGASRRVLRAVEADPGTIGVVPPAAVRPTVTVARVAGVDPVADDPAAVTVAFVGDVMLLRSVPDPAAALRPMAPLLRGADLAVGNLESTLSTDGEVIAGQSDPFGGSPALLGPLRAAGFDALSLANNHTGDYGGNALVETVRAFRGSGIAAFGAGRDLERASRPAYVDAGGLRLALIGFNAIGETPAATEDGPGALQVSMPIRTGSELDRRELGRVERLVREAGERADAVVVLPHWGDQYTHVPLPVQHVVGRALVRAGADLVVGGHPHWVQGLDAVAEVPVLHSLGNFVFDMDADLFGRESHQGVVAETTWLDGELRALRLVPYEMDPPRWAPRVVRGDLAADVLDDVWSASTGPFAR